MSHALDAAGPTTISCFGPVSTVAQAKALYSTCSTGYQTLCTSLGEITYDLDCPIFNQQGTGSTYNMVKPASALGFSVPCVG